MVGEIVTQREPIWRKIEDRIDQRAHRLRNRILNDPLERRVPRLGQRNIGEGIGAGIIEAGIAVILEETVGVPFGSDAEIVDSRVEGNNRIIYVVNVDAPIKNMAQARAFLDATTGFTSILMDRWQVDNVEVVNHRLLRDTYQIEVLVED